MGAAVALIFAASVLMGCTNLAQGYAEPASPEIRVAGKVLCQDCTQPWNQWVIGAKPIQGSIVSITCMDERRRVVHYASDVTDQYGQFDFSINVNVYGHKKLNPKLCKARLVSSPDSDCNVLTDFAHGQTGVSLSWPTSILEDYAKYTLGPFYFTTQTCQKPEASAYNSQYNNAYANNGNY
ncbi:Pollen Ole e 1 allergen and extensin family protein [Parasponia andersonii]|uniref:Pollen Ole e 1 allergen and extensin family protein n=1 Tax=Parasponia andersonii TaxID=3476 RepID=A0A2P5C562_PARAD|nr:Pollen Ole e 1 allergen and extensin family protein [Parasponia andersonii]